jgi:CRP-like cAMP-binding protein
LTCWKLDKEYASKGQIVEVRTLEMFLEEHPLLRGLNERYPGLLAGYASGVRFRPRELIFRQGDPAEHFYLIRDGRVSVELQSPYKGTQIIQTLGAGEVLGCSWLFPPYQWYFDARSIENTSAIRIDGATLRRKCDQDPALGYTLMKRFSAIMHERMQTARLQLPDLYGPMSG